MCTTALENQFDDVSTYYIGLFRVGSKIDGEWAGVESYKCDEMSTFFSTPQMDYAAAVLAEEKRVADEEAEQAKQELIDNFADGGSGGSGVGGRFRRGDKDTCKNNLKSRCNAGRLFSIVGLLASVAAVAAAVMKKKSTIIGATNALAAFSTMLCMALIAQLHSGDMDAEKAGCGLDSGDYKYGSAFVCFVVAFLVSTIAAVVGFKSKEEGAVSPQRVKVGQ